MHRRSYLAMLGTATTMGVAGCAGGKVVHSLQKTVTVTPGRGMLEELPANGNKIKFIARDERPFDVYVFTDPENVQYYRAYLDGEDPEETPFGDRSLGGRASRISPNVFEVATKNRGRQSLDGDGPAYFVLDHSGYRHETVPGDQPTALSVTLDLEVVESTLPF